jgi:hypothetical protein
VSSKNKYPDDKNHGEPHKGCQQAEDIDARATISAVSVALEWRKKRQKWQKEDPVNRSVGGFLLVATPAQGHS